MPNCALYLRGPGQGTLTFVPSSNPVLADLHSFVEESLGISKTLVRLSSGGIPLDHCSACLQTLPTPFIDIDARLRGGKTHGKLNQAGKVKGLTPQVEPQEKKKAKTGRARKRALYNKRFVATVQQVDDGRRRGPNSNR